MDHITFIFICIAVTASPGPAVLLALKHGSKFGFRRALVGIAGNILAMLLLALVSSAGLGAIISSSAIAFTLIKIVGAIYLIYLGVIAWRRTPEGFDSQIEKKDAGMLKWNMFRESFFVGISNLKAIAFYSALFPQLIDPGGSVIGQFIVLGAIFAICSFSFLSLHAAISARLSFLLKKRNVQRWTNRITGGLSVGFGAVFAASSRT